MGKLVKVYTYDWKEDVSSFFENLREDWQGEKCYFYMYDGNGDYYCYVVSNAPLTEEEVNQYGQSS